MPIYVPKDRKSLFRQFLSGIYDAVVITDPNGYIIETNQRASELFGYELGEVLDRPISIFVPSLTEEVVQRIRKSQGGNRRVMVDAMGKNMAGESFACELAVALIDMTHPGDLVFTIRNVERRRRVLDSLRLRASAFQFSPIALFGCDAEGHVLEANDAFLEMFGLGDLESARAHVFADLMSDEPLAEKFQLALAGEPSITEIVAESDDGNRESVEVSLSLGTYGRRKKGVIGAIRKVTNA